MDVESKVLRQFKKEGLEPCSWSNGPHFAYGVHEQGASKKAVEMRAGDRLPGGP